MEKNQTTACRTGNQEEKMEMDWTYSEEASQQCDKTEPEMEPTGKAEEGKAEIHLGTRFGGWSETDGAQLARGGENCPGQRQVESSS